MIIARALLVLLILGALLWATTQGYLTLIELSVALVLLTLAGIGLFERRR